ncbi:MAG: ribosomal protein S18-alanine N-acetyltransferase [Egibacteraceae bacterium]
MIRPPAERNQPQVTPMRPALAVQVVSLRSRHLDEVMAIEQAVYPKPWTRALFADELRRTKTRHYLAALAPPASRWPPGRRWGRGRLVGYAGMLVQAGETHVTTVAVHPHQHRKKVASHLLVGLMQAALAADASAATLEVRVANRGAQRLYTAFGFAPVGVRPGYYAETAEDALVMWVHDLQAPAFAEALRGQIARLGSPGGASGAPDLHVPWVRGRNGLPSPRVGR